MQLSTNECTRFSISVVAFRSSLFYVDLTGGKCGKHELFVTFVINSTLLT